METKPTFKYCIFIFLLSIACISSIFGKDFVQRIEWEGDNSVLRYEIQIKDENKKITTYETKNTYIDVSLPAGKYYYSLLIYDLLNRLSLTTDWYPLEITQALQPIIDSVELSNKKPLFGDTLTVIITGTDFEEKPAIVLSHLETNTEYVGKITKFSDTKIEIKFDNIEIPEGKFDVKLENPCGFFTNYRTFQFSYEYKPEIQPLPEKNITLLPWEEIAIPIEGKGFLETSTVTLLPNNDTPPIDASLTDISEDGTTAMVVAEKTGETIESGYYSINITNPGDHTVSLDKLYLETTVEPEIQSIQKNEITLKQGQKNELMCSVSGLLEKTTFFLTNSENDKKIPLSYKVVALVGNSTIITISFPNAMKSGDYQLCMENPRELIDNKHVIKIIVLHNTEWYLSTSTMYPIYYTGSGLVLKDDNFYSIGLPIQVSFGVIPINTSFGSFGFDLSASYQIFVAESDMLIQNLKIVSAYPGIQYQKQIVNQKLVFNLKAGIGISLLGGEINNKSDMSLNKVLNYDGYFSSIVSGSLKLYPFKYMLVEIGCDFIYMNIPIVINNFVMPKIGIGFKL
jgi:hypothetical protein